MTSASPCPLPTSHRHRFCPMLCAVNARPSSAGQVVRLVRAIGVHEGEEIHRRARRECILRAEAPARHIEGPPPTVSHALMSAGGHLNRWIRPLGWKRGRGRR